MKFLASCDSSFLFFLPLSKEAYPTNIFRIILNRTVSFIKGNQRFYDGT